jgi:hypothetical protein
VAFRDLNKARFGQAWDAVRNEPFDASFTCTELALLRHAQGEWRIFRVFALAGVAQ